MEIESDTKRFPHAQSDGNETPRSDEQLTCEDQVLLGAHIETMFCQPPPLDVALVTGAVPAGASVLVVGADKHRRRKLCAALARKRQIHSVDDVASDWRALERVGQEHPHVVVLDLPDRLRGIELVPKLRECSPHSTLIVTSLAAARSVGPAATALGASCYFQRTRKRSTRRLATVLARFAAAAA